MEFVRCAADRVRFVNRLRKVGFDLQTCALRMLKPIYAHVFDLQIECVLAMFSFFVSLLLDILYNICLYVLVGIC